MNTSGDAQFSASAQPSAVHLPIDLLIRILIHAEELDSIVVGGQALNIWGERYFDRARDELAAFTPFQSKDIDFFGDVHDAEKLAHMLEGNLKLPSRDNFVTPSTAMIDIKVQNQHHVVDFLHAVAGIDARVMRERAMTLGIALEHEGRPRQTEILLLHPIDVLLSRIAGITLLGRNDPGALRQLGAAPIIVREFIRELLDTSDHEDRKQAQNVIREFIKIGGSTHAAKVMALYKIDILAEAVKLADHPTWDPRFAHRQIQTACERAVTKRDQINREARRKAQHRGS